jgi:hypothetical protein
LIEVLFFPVILSEAKNLIFYFQIKKIKKEDPSDLRPQDDEQGKLTKILKQFRNSIDFSPDA